MSRTLRTETNGSGVSGPALLPRPAGDGWGEGEAFADFQTLGNEHASRATSESAQSPVLIAAAWHSLAWLVIANGIGLLLATLLLFPSLNHWLGEWTYGRWMPLHLNLHLYGWCSLPAIGWLLKVYGADRAPSAKWGRTGLWAWSTALVIGAISWLNGHTSGKLFLDWQGYSLMVLLLSGFVLWFVLAWSLQCHWRISRKVSVWKRLAQLLGLLLLLPVPPVLYWSAAPHVYPPVNPHTGGPTGVSLLGSTLAIIVILLLLPFGLSERVAERKRRIAIVWGMFAATVALFFSLDHGNTSHHQLGQILGLGSLLLWVPLLWIYFTAFAWPEHTAWWRRACLTWWTLLVMSAWLVFLPGILDRLKFTDGLVGHSHMAMAGFVSSLNVLLLALLLGRKGRIFTSSWAFVAWQAGALGYVALMFGAGWIEGRRVDWTMEPGWERNVVYSARLFCGTLMFAASMKWFLGVRSLANTKTV